MYQVEFRSPAAREFEKLDQAVAARLLKKLH
jgi:mRNA-degrading endonuclease RelE of RelBE toxin-antitoxin system